MPSRTALHSTTWCIHHNNKNGNIFLLLFISPLHWLTSTSRLVSSSSLSVVSFPSPFHHSVSSQLSPSEYKYLHAFLYVPEIYISSKIEGKDEITNVNGKKWKKSETFFCLFFFFPACYFKKNALLKTLWIVCAHYFFLFSSPWQICIKGRKKWKKKKLVGKASNQSHIYVDCV